MEKNSLERNKVSQQRQDHDSMGSDLAMTPPQFKLSAGGDSSADAGGDSPAQMKTDGGMPGDLVGGFAQTTGHDLSNVQVHYNSNAPSQVGALAYAQGNDIHLGPGQEQHLAHEAAHVVQQREGRVQANTSVNGMAVNDSKSLESEADSMGAKAAQMKTAQFKAVEDESENAKSEGNGAKQMKTAQLKAAEDESEVAKGDEKGPKQLKEGDDPLKVGSGQVTFDSEGNDDAKSRYFSRVVHWPGGVSGVTIGRGYDLGQRTKKSCEAHLKAAGITGSQSTLLLESVGLTGKAAGDWVTANKDKVGSISHEQQKILFDVVYAEHKKDVVRLSNKEDVKEKYGEVDFDALHPAIMDILVDLRYRGDYHSRSRAWIQPLAVKNDLKGFAAAMADTKWKTDYGVPADRFNRRRDFMAAALKGGPKPNLNETDNSQNTQAPTTGTPIDTGKVTASSLNIRSGPGSNHPKVGSPLTAGAAVKVYEKSNGWLRIGNGQWVSGEYVELAGKKPTTSGGGSGNSQTTSNTNQNSGGDSGGVMDWLSDKASDAYDAAAGLLDSVADTVSGIGDALFGSGNTQTPANKPATPSNPANQNSAPANNKPVATATVKAATLNVRSGPGPSNEKIGTIKQGEKVQIFEEKDGWARIGQGRWVSGEYLDKGNGAPANKPAANSSPQAKPAWISTAEAEIGQSELKESGKHNPRIVEYHGTTGKFKDDETPWCASFVTWCFVKSGFSGTGSARALSYQTFGKNVKKPAYGAVGVIDWGGGKGHVGFVVGMQGKNVLLLGGNQGDSVKVSSFPVSKFVAFTFPGDYEVPASAYSMGQSGDKVESGGDVHATR
jgi:uncharacterized protein (TIGR02594 family)